jgi:hypothetical protein
VGNFKMEVFYKRTEVNGTNQKSQYLILTQAY